MIDQEPSLEGKKLVVIGGASGIGFAVAELARARGAAVLIASSSEARVAAAVGRLPGATGGTVDLRDEGSVAAFFAKVGPFDHLAITAGDWTGAWRVPIRDLDLAQARDTFTVRFWGSLVAVKHAARVIAADGSITLTSGLLAHRPLKGAPLGAAMAGALEHLARGLAIDLAPVRVNAVCPGVVLTEHVRAVMPQDRLAAVTSRQPVPRAASPVEAAQAYLYLMLNGYVTGQVLPVDGGGLVA